MEALDARTKLASLRQLSLFESLDRAELSRLARDGVSEVVQRRALIYSIRQPSDRVLVLLTGSAKITRPAGPRDVALGIACPGDLIGEMSLLGERVRSDTAMALERATLCGFESGRFDAYLRRHPELSLRIAIASAIASRLRETRERIESLLSQDVKTRLARTLATLAGVHGVRAREGRRIELRLTQTDLAELIGSTRETTSTAFNDLRRNGWVATDRRGVVVRDMPALREG